MRNWKAINAFAGEAPFDGKSSPVCAVEPCTATTAERAAEPPAPWHDNVKVLLAAVSGPVLAEPAVGFAPDQLPLALHDVAFVDDQVRFEAPPLATLVGLAVS